MKKPISLRSRRARRGAVLVESIVVISFFTLCFLGVVYFREVYVAKLQVQRLARASAMAHAMSACKADPKTGLEKDLPAPPVEGRTPLGSPDSKASGKAAEALKQAQSGAPLAEIGEITLTTSASATTRTDQQAKEQGFRSNVGSTSFVTCMDPVSTDGVEEVLPRLKSIAESFL